MKTLLLILGLLPLVAPAQDWTWTETKWERVDRPEDRRLVLSGKYVDADTVLVQIYHDGEETVEPTITYGIFTITLSEFDSYDIKFTDTQKRVKRITVRELGDRMIEFYPPMEIDFDRIGNYVLIKPDAKLPDYAELDVGVNRKVGKPARP